MRQLNQPSFLRSFGLALTLETVLIGGVLMLMLLAPQQRALPVVPLVIDALVDKLAPQLEMASPRRIAPIIKSATAVVPVTPPTPASPTLPSKEPAKAEPLPMAAPSAFVASSTATPVHSAATTPQVARAAAQSVVDPSAAYNAQLAAAVQAAFQVPLAAQELAFKGRTRVEFLLRDGRISSPRIIQGSGLGVADRAAIKAVQSAVYPSPPDNLKGKDGIYQIWVACV